MKPFAARETPSRDDRPATRILHDSEDVRVISFHLLPGQEVPPHRSSSTVTVQVVEGAGDFAGQDVELRLNAGEGAVYEPNEMHSMRAIGGALRFLAILSPRPS